MRVIGLIPFFCTAAQCFFRNFITERLSTWFRHCMCRCTGKGLGGGVKLQTAGWVAWHSDEGLDEMLTAVILLAFLSMSEALSRKGYLLVPGKAETADPAHSPCPSLPLADRLCEWCAGLICVRVCVCVPAVASVHMFIRVCLWMNAYVMKRVCVSVSVCACLRAYVN